MTTLALESPVAKLSLDVNGNLVHTKQVEPVDMGINRKGTPGFIEMDS